MRIGVGHGQVDLPDIWRFRSPLRWENLREPPKVLSLPLPIHENRGDFPFRDSRVGDHVANVYGGQKLDPASYVQLRHDVWRA